LVRITSPYPTQENATDRKEKSVAGEKKKEVQLANMPKRNRNAFLMKFEGIKLTG
jgi:hypothetical protein